MKKKLLAIHLIIVGPVVAVAFLVGVICWAAVAGYRRAYDFQNWLGS